MALETRAEIYREYPVFEHSDTVQIDGRFYSLVDLYCRFAFSPIGKHQALQEPRFHKVFPLKNGDYEGHIELLGPDSHPTEHMLHTTGNIVIPAIVRQPHNAFFRQFTPKEQAVLVVTSQIHDTDEAEHPFIADLVGNSVGDVPSFMVTEEHESKKAEIRKHIIYPRFYGDFSDELIESIEGVIRHNGPGFLPEAFKRLEQFGYMLTAQKAANLAVKFRHSENEEERILSDKLTELAQKVEDENKHNIKIGAKILELIRNQCQQIFADIHLATSV